MQQHARIAAQHRQRRAQIVGEGRVEALALLHLPPHHAVVFPKGPAHFLKGGAQCAHLVPPVPVDGKVQVLFGNLARSHIQKRNRPLELSAVKQGRTQRCSAAVAEGKAQDGQHRKHHAHGALLLVHQRNHGDQIGFCPALIPGRLPHVAQRHARGHAVALGQRNLHTLGVENAVVHAVLVGPHLVAAVLRDFVFLIGVPVIPGIAVHAQVFKAGDAQRADQRRQSKGHQRIRPKGRPKRPVPESFPLLPHSTHL